MRFALILAVFVGCTQPQSESCTFICAREGECIKSTKPDMPFEEKECIAACAVLEQDPSNAAKVEKHKACIVKNEHACKAILDTCQ